MIDVATKEGFYCYVNSHSTWYEIKNYISLGLPVIVDFIEPTSDEGHYAVVIACTSHHLVLHDPWNGKNFKISQKYFLKCWHDPLTHSHGWIMVIAKEDFQLGKQYLPN